MRRTRFVENWRGAFGEVCVLLAIPLCVLCGPGLVQAGLIRVETVDSASSEGMPYGAILREIRVEGNAHTKESVIRHALKSQVGYPYTQENARKDRLWIMRLGAFTSVQFRAEPLEDGFALIVLVTEMTPYIPSLSFALTQENGVEIGPAFSSSNLFKTAARASIYARFGGATNIGIQYRDPLLQGKKRLFGYSFEYFHRERRNELLDYQEQSDELYVEMLLITSDFTRTGVRFRYLGLHADRSGVTIDPDDTDRIPSLGLFIQNDSRNSVYPTSGWYLDLEGGRYGILGGTAEYWRFDLDARRYTPLHFMGERHSLALTTYLSLLNGTLGETIPFHQAAFIGGTNSVRGWSLSSREGKNQWLGTVEYWFRLMEQKRWNLWFLRWLMGFQVAAFGDFGTAWSEPEELEGNMIAGAGVGFRFSLPVVTMIRVDLAYGQDGPGLRLFVGGKEKADAQKLRVR